MTILRASCRLLARPSVGRRLSSLILSGALATLLGCSSHASGGTAAASDASSGTDMVLGDSAVAVPDAGSAAGSDAGTDTATDTAEPQCTSCLFTQPPPAPHPGGPGPLDLAPAQTISYGSGPLESYKQILVLRPQAAGSYPTVLFAAGKQLYQGGGLPGQLGYGYRAFLEHIASHGYAVAFVRVEQGLLDSDQLRMADDLLAASQTLWQQVAAARADQVAYVGHSMGAKVALLAAWRATAGDANQEHPDPQAVLAFAAANEPPPMGTYQDATDKLKQVPADVPTWFTLATGDDDEVAPWNAAGKSNASALYQALATPHRQLLVLHGTGAGDPNPPTKPELSDDHAAPLSIEGKNGGAADFAMPASHLDALDWYGFWKWTVGALDFHFKGGHPSWAYGALRTHGGTTADGQVLQHAVAAQGW
ncbi:MAG: hypothetical protein HY902_16930 [Deltaproteobacteria bacterium]|nr:hypothetical protein [Deltaproteobacteria bacterium]